MQQYNYKAKNKAKDLFESYLSNRKQLVQIGEIVSKIKPISMGVPQGSVIGPLLLIIAVHYIRLRVFNLLKRNTPFFTAKIDRYAASTFD